MSEPNGKNLQLCIESDPACLGQVRNKVEQFALSVGMDEDSAGRVVLALDEALTNVIRHAYKGQIDMPIEITVVVDDDTLCVTVRDYGLAVERSKIKSRDLNEVRPGGLGVHIMTECMDKVEFTTPEDGGGTILIMTKGIPPQKLESNEED